MWCDQRTGDEARRIEERLSRDLRAEHGAGHLARAVRQGVVLALYQSLPGITGTGAFLEGVPQSREGPAAVGSGACAWVREVCDGTGVERVARPENTDGFARYFPL